MKHEREQNDQMEEEESDTEEEEEEAHHTGRAGGRAGGAHVLRADLGGVRWPLPSAAQGYGMIATVMTSGRTIFIVLSHGV